MTRPIIFLDDGGVMNDNRLRGPQWQRLVGDYFAPRLGGTQEAWAEANRIVVERMLEPAAWQAYLQSASDYRSFYYQYQLDWLSGMCQLVAVPAPAEEECYRLACEATAAIIPQVRAAFPGAVDTIRLLHAQGYRLYTASGAHSSELEGHLEGMGVRECFQRLYGADLINTFKNGPAYYERLFADARVDPARALILDDSPQAIAWASQVGAQTILVGNASAEAGANHAIASLAHLPDVLHQFD
jgi:HAD superfamily hydrolase (TIGR01509 family)